MGKQPSSDSKKPEDRILALEKQIEKARLVLLIAGACLVAFGGFTYQSIPERARKAVDDETSKKARKAVLDFRDEAERAAVQSKKHAEAVERFRESFGTNIFGPEIFQVRSTGRAEDSQAKPITGKDICLLSSIGFYGDAKKGCSLTKTNEGWALTASSRNSTANCEALCFDLHRPK